jgi:hypothetical protein
LFIPLFKSDVELNGLVPDPMYISTRDNAQYTEVKLFLESVYAENFRYIGDPPRQFENQFVQRFEDTLWHLCLLDYLKRSGFELGTPPAIGPDIKARKADKTYWIEAVNSGMGMHVGNPAFSDRGVSVEWSQANDPRVTSRLVSAIKEKAAKFKRYIPNPVNPIDIKIIAVSAHVNLRASRGSNGRSFMDIVLNERTSIPNPSGGADIDLGLFNKPEYFHIDQVLYSPLDPIRYVREGVSIFEKYQRGTRG